MTKEENIRKILESKNKNWNAIPLFRKNLAERGVCFYNQLGEVDDMPKEIAKRMEELDESNIHIVAVFNDLSYFGEGESAEMFLYVYISYPNSEPTFIDGNDMRFYAVVDNVSWGISEHGSIGLRQENDRLIRSY